MNFFRRPDDVVLLGQLAGFAIVEHENVDPAKQFKQVFQRDIEPEIHRVGDDQFRMVHLVEHPVLQRRGNVGQQDKRRPLIGLRQFRSVPTR